MFKTGEPLLVTIIGTQQASSTNYGAGTIKDFDYIEFHTVNSKVYSYEDITSSAEGKKDQWIKF